MHASQYTYNRIYYDYVICIASKVLLLVVLVVTRARARSIEFILICFSLFCNLSHRDVGRLYYVLEIATVRENNARARPDQLAPSVLFSRSNIQKALASWYIYDAKHNCVSVYIGFGCNNVSGRSSSSSSSSRVDDGGNDDNDIIWRCCENLFWTTYTTFCRQTVG